MAKTKHSLFDMPIISYFLLLLIIMVVENIGNIGDIILAFFLPGYASMYIGPIPIATGIFTGASTLLALLIFKWVFTKEYKGILKPAGALPGLKLLIPFIAIQLAGSIVSICTLGITTPLGILVAFLRCLAPGIGEEMMFRGMGVGNYMRVCKDEKGILKITVISSVVFGAVHISNVIAGASLFDSAIQAVFAAGVGFALCGAYLRTGSLLCTIAAHSLIDFAEFLRADISASAGVMQGMGVGDWITVGAGFFGFFWGLYLIRKSKRAEILEVWKKTWGTSNMPPYEVIPEESVATE